jgi:hypothetical protein
MKQTWLILLFAFLISQGCKRESYHIDVSGIDTLLTISRFEQQLFSADPSALEDYIPRWKSEYGDFLRNFSYVVKLGNIDDPAFANRLRLFVTDPTNYLVYKKTMEVFPNLDAFHADLNEAFKHYRYYFNDMPVPRIVTYVSGIGQSAITDDSLLAIGLDKYLGSGEEMYARMGMFQYLLRNMHPDRLVPDCMLFWGETEFPFSDSVNNLVSNMIYNGKLLYFVSAMLPDAPDSLCWGMSNRGIDYCMENEKYMWTKMIEDKFLFNTDRFTIDKFILEGPFTKDFGRDSPAKAAVWIGYRIVRAYMSQNREINLRQLMEENDYMKILNQSSYNP